MSDVLRSWSETPAEHLLEVARAQGVLSSLDLQFGNRLAALYGEATPGMRWALALASRQESGGHVCADLRRLEAEGILGDSAGLPVSFSLLATHGTLDAWLEEIRQSSLVETVESGDGKRTEPKPLVIDGHDRLYLRRSFEAQRRLSDLIRERTRADEFDVDWDLAEAGIARLVGDDSPGDDAPLRALRTALRRPLAIVTGGPGTGKTTMVARLVALLVEQALGRGAAPPRVRLLAPTGKAASAMTLAFGRQRESLTLAPEVREAMTCTAETLHRALHRRTRRDAFGREADFALTEDLVVVDEASMVDLELMQQLFSACRSTDRVVLLGDPGQLASIDAGAVLSEICDASGGVADAVVTLRTSHRYSEAGGIGRLAEAIREGDADRVIELLDDPSLPEVRRFDVGSVDAVRERLVEASREIHRAIEATDGLDRKLDRMGAYRVLCAHRRGPLGVEALCRTLDDVSAAERHVTRRSGWWLGRLLLITQNSPDQDLWNGDVGLIEETPSGLRAIFSGPSGDVRSFTPARLPSHESAIAMSVHKSQGSEFDSVDLVLGTSISRLMTRELLYTGVTRARRELRIHASEDVLREAVAQRISRDSALRELLEVD